MSRTKQTARRHEPTHDGMKAAYRDARLAATPAARFRDYEGWRALFAKASPEWLNDQRLVLPANERAGMHDYARALREALTMPRP